MYCKFHFLFVLLFLCSVSCVGQNNKQNIKKKDNNMVEKIDFDFLEKHAEKSELMELHPQKVIHYEFEEIQDDGTKIYIVGNSYTGFEEVRIPPLPAYWKEYKRYYPSGIIKEKGKEIESMEPKIGIWFYYNENGILMKEVDHDKRFGKFSHKNVVDFLVEKKHLGENYGGIDRVGFYYNEEKQQWEISVHSEVIMYEYCIDGNSGEVLRQETIYMEE